MTLIKRIGWYFEKGQKEKIFKHLKMLPETQLVEWGYSPTLLRQGISAWPWREEENRGTLEVDNKRAEVQRSITELQRFTDAELADLGLSRGCIEYSVRHGRPGIDTPGIDTQRTRQAAWSRVKYVHRFY